MNGGSGSGDRGPQFVLAASAIHSLVVGRRGFRVARVFAAWPALMLRLLKKSFRSSFQCY